MNLSVIHAWKKGNFKSVFRIDCTKMLINFINLPNTIYNQTRNTNNCRLQWRKTNTKRVNDRSFSKNMSINARLTLLHPRQLRMMQCKYAFSSSFKCLRITHLARSARCPCCFILHFHCKF